MKVIHINKSDIIGGSARAVFRLNQALSKNQIASNVLVQEKDGDHEKIKTVAKTKFQKGLALLRPILNHLFLTHYNKKSNITFSPAKIGVDITKYDIVRKADIINLHWINWGYLSLSSIKKLNKLNKPIVWTFHDMWAFTGGCQYSHGCKKYRQKCGKCPLLNSSKQNDISRKIWNKKKRILKI